MALTLQPTPMPRKPHIHLLGGFYHVMPRGNREQDIFFAKADRWGFLDLVAEACDVTGHLARESQAASLIGAARRFDRDLSSLSRGMRQVGPCAGQDYDLAQRIESLNNATLQDPVPGYAALYFAPSSSLSDRNTTLACKADLMFYNTFASRS